LSIAAVSGALALAVVPALSQGPAPAARQALIDDLVTANRILANEGVVDGYGHVSVRNPANASHYLLARAGAPALVTPADIVEYDLESSPISGAGAGYMERFIHGEIYKARPDIMAVVHSHSPSVIPFGATGIPLKPLYHMSAFLVGGAPVFDIRAASGGMTDMLVKTPVLGAALARTLGRAPVTLMRGHGAVVVGVALPQVVFRSVYTEVNAKLQAQAMALGGPVTYLDPDEARQAEASIAGTLGRPWELWRKKALSR
jgi:HCOMODA/2-hydroxy-3-carboxy-muconic semialdehyde decarboxylase